MEENLTHFYIKIVYFFTGKTCIDVGNKTYMLGKNNVFWRIR